MSSANSRRILPSSRLRAPAPDLVPRTSRGEWTSPAVLSRRRRQPLTASLRGIVFAIRWERSAIAVERPLPTREGADEHHDGALVDEELVRPGMLRLEPAIEA